MALEVFILNIVVLLAMLSNVRWRFGKRETALVFNLVFDRDKAKEAFGKSMGAISTCPRYAAQREYQQRLGEATGQAVVGKSLPPNCQEKDQPIFPRREVQIRRTANL